MSALARLLADHSLEVTGKDVVGLREAADGIAPGTRVNVTYLGTETSEERVAAARAARELGLVAVPHIAARRLATSAELEGFLAALEADGNADNVFVVGGDPPSPHGPYADALAVIESGLLHSHGVRHVGIGGYPEGHPHIDTDTLWSALSRKASALRGQGLDAEVITQFGFDSAAVLRWVEQARARGLDLPIRVGVPGPAGVRRLLRYASRFGVASSAGIARKYGLSLTNLMGTAGPDRFLDALAEGYDESRHGVLRLHFYTFGGVAAAAQWIARFSRAARTS